MMLHSAIGTVSEIAGTECVSTSKGEEGFALFGPYTLLEPGHYIVKFRMRLAEDTARDYADDILCCVVDVAAANGVRIIARRPVLAWALQGGNSEFSLRFAISEPQLVEFRVNATGRAPLVIEAARPLTGPLRTDDLSDSRGAEQSGFRRQYSHKLRELEDCGAEVTALGDAALVSFFGVRLLVKNSEDFQLIHEIFHLNSYNFAASQDVVAMDIGMNIGLASLYLARMPNVRHVYSFEPFPVPRARALENFALNPDLARKITVHEFGLSDNNEELAVRYDEAQTISTSIKGKSSGAETKILVRDAAEIFSELLLGLRGLDLVVKMDCEGSEFPIFETLDKRGLLKYVRVFMIEWHKWWSANKTQHDLITRLIAGGFVVLDHTNPFDPYAGQLYAIRAG